MTNEVPGQQVEDYARRLAGDLGVRDFVCQPIVIRKGKGVREISDGLLVAGNEGLILQVKSRDPDAARLDDPMKAEGMVRQERSRRRPSGGWHATLSRDRPGGGTGLSGGSNGHCRARRNGRQ